MLMPFNDPTWEPVRHIAPPPASLPDINSPDTDMHKVLADLTANAPVAHQKIMVRPLMADLGNKLTGTIDTETTSTALTTHLFTDLQEQIEANKVAAWGETSMMKGQRIQHPATSLETIVQEADKSLKNMGVDKATRYWFAEQIIESAGQHIAPAHAKYEGLNVLTETRDGLAKFRNNTTNPSANLRPGINRF